MIENNNLLVIGGTKRNIGKTSLIEKIILKYSTDYEIVAFKIKTIYEDDSFFHGKDRNPLLKNENYRLIEEINKDGNEDTNRFLKAGAIKSYKIKTKVNFLNYAFNDLLTNLNSNTLLICESNSIIKYIKPALYLFVKELNSEEIKPSAKKMLQFANKIITTDGKKHNFNLNNLFIKENKWMLNKL